MNTETTYLGLRLAHPFIAGASPMGYSLDHVKRLEDGGCAAVVLHSLFEEQITQEREGRIAGRTVGERDFADIHAHFPEPSSYPLTPDQYAEHIRRLKQAVSVPIIGSLNGRTKAAWLKFATAIQEAGADGLELNMYQVVTDLGVAVGACRGTADRDRQRSEGTRHHSGGGEALSFLLRVREPGPSS